MAEQRVVIADAGPLIAVSRVCVLHLLPSMFGDVWITDAVLFSVTPWCCAILDRVGE